MFTIVVNTSFRAAPWADYVWAMDVDWHREYGKEARAACSGTICAPHIIPGAEFHDIAGGNSGATALLLAAKLGATEIIMTGYDCQHTGGAAHWHADHPKHMGNAGSVDRWPGHFETVAKTLQAQGVTVRNATRETALQCFERAALADCLALPRKPLVIAGMHGMGDCLHQRAIVRAYMARHVVHLVTPWPELYHDLRGDRLKLVKPTTRLRTQAKNVARAEFDADRFQAGAQGLQVSYPPQMVRDRRGVLPAMAAQCGVPHARDFDMHVPDDWAHGLDLPTDRPVLVYRPLVERKEWGGCGARNPDAAAYVAVFKALRDKLGAFVVSIADVQPGAEWIVSEDVCADLTLHAGELDIKGLCALWKRADLIYSAPGFGLVLAQAVGAPVVSMFGGYERAYSFRDDAKTCKIEPLNPCDCFTHHHGCGKKMDVQAATRRALEFIQ